MKEALSADHLLKRPQLAYEDIEAILGVNEMLDADVKEQVEIQTKYEGYIKKQLEQVDRLKKMERKRIPEWIDYDDIQGIAMEARQKLKEVRPLSVGQASRVSGVNPADISILLVYLEQGRQKRTS